MKRLRAISMASVLALGATGCFLYLSGYFTDPQSALRQLEKRGLAPTVEEVFAAVERDDSETLALLCRAGAPLDGKDSSGNSPLHVAAQERKWNSAGILLQQPLDLNALNGSKQVVLQSVLEDEHLAFAGAMLQRGASPDSRYDTGQPALIEAIRNRHIQAVRLLLRHGADPNIVNGAGTNPLYLAIRSGQGDLVPRLLEAGSAAGSTSPEGQPVLNFLCQHYQACGYTEEKAIAMLRELLHAGADPQATEPGGKRPLGHALEQDFTLAVKELLPLVDDVRDTLWIALSRGDMELVETLLGKGADVNQRREDGETPLTFAVRAKRPDLVYAFMDRGADPTLAGKEGQAAVPLAIALGDERTTLTLLGHPRAPQPGRTLNHPVTPEFRRLVSNDLLDFYLRHTHGITPLMCAVCLDQEAVVLKLLECGADRYAATAPKKVLAIQLAARRKNVRLQQILLGVPYEDTQQRRLFVINLGKQEVTFYKEGAPVKVAKISSGRPSHPTEPGTYVITDKSRMHHSNIYDDAEMPYFQRFSCTALGFHQGPLPGHAASHGCVRLSESAASYFFEESEIGDRVVIEE